MPATDGTWRIGIGRDAARRWAGPRLVLVFAAALLLGVAVVLAARRAAGALTGPLPAWRLLTTALVVAAWGWGVRVVWWRQPPTEAVPALADHLVRWLPSGSILLVAIACSWPGGRWIDWLVWVPIVAGEWFGPRLRGVPAQPSALRRTVPGSPAMGSTTGGPAREDQLLQELTRVCRADGSEMVRGALVAQFAPGVRSVALYAAFCPPLARLPRVQAEITGGPDATVKVVQVLTGGVRIDVQLARAAERAECVWVEMVATDGDIPW